MRKTLLFMITWISLNGFAQSTVQYIDPTTKVPVCGIYAHIFKNENTFQDCGGSDEEGYFSLKIDNADPSATYQFSFNDPQYKPVWKEIDIHDPDTLVVALIPDDYYMENTEDMFANGCNTISLFNYEPREPRSLDELPADIVEKVTSHLKSRVGEKFFRNLRFVGGQIVELDELKKVNKYWKNSQTAYYLCFSYRNLEAGIGMYVSKIELDAKGNVIKEIDFPKVEGDALHENIVSLKAVKEKARQRGFYTPGKTQTDMAYYTKSNILVWKFINETFKEDNTYTKEELIYNAHTGNFIKVTSSKGEWIE